MSTSDGIILLLGIILFMTPLILYILLDAKKKSKQVLSHQINEDSFQNYAKFFGEIVPSDSGFDSKMNTILTLINDKKITDIKKISEVCECTVPQCVLRIKYLKNKRLIDDYYIDTVNMQLLPCSKEDQVLLDKYKPYIYGSHTQIVEFAHLIPNPDKLSFDEHKKKIFEELNYLDEKGLLNGVKINDVNGEILYYSIEKRKTVFNIETVHCPNCGSLNDVEVNNQTRCSYCKTIINGSKYSDTQEKVL